MEQLKEQIKVVAEARKLAQAEKMIVAELREKWETENHTVLDLADKSLEGMREAETKLRELTLKAYAETGNKAPAPGVSIRVRTILSYLGSKALEWAMEHKMALKLDTSAFEKIVKATPLDFVTITQEPQATIATKLEEVE